MGDCLWNDMPSGVHLVLDLLVIGLLNANACLWVKNFLCCHVCTLAE